MHPEMDTAQRYECLYGCMDVRICSDTHTHIPKYIHIHISISIYIYTNTNTHIRTSMHTSPHPRTHPRHIPTHIHTCKNAWTTTMTSTSAPTSALNLSASNGIGIGVRVGLGIFLGTIGEKRGVGMVREGTKARTQGRGFIPAGVMERFIDLPGRAGLIYNKAYKRRACPDRCLDELYEWIGM